MPTISKQEAINALKRLGLLALAAGETVELLLVGGGAMVIMFDARESTKDLDVAVLAPTESSRVREWTRQVAEDLQWPPDWLKHAAKGFLVGSSVTTELFSAPGIVVRVPSIEQLLAMKPCAFDDLWENLHGQH